MPESIKDSFVFLLSRVVAKRGIEPLNDWHHECTCDSVSRAFAIAEQTAVGLPCDHEFCVVVWSVVDGIHVVGVTDKTGKVDYSWTQANIKHGSLAIQQAILPVMPFLWCEVETFITAE